MTPTKRHVNWTGVSFTPTGGSATNYTGTTSCSHDPGGTLLKFAGDGDRYNTTVINDFNEPSFSISSADIAAVKANPVGTVGALTATLNDAKNLAVTGSGAIIFNLANAIVSDFNVSGSHRQYAMGKVDFESYSTDGITSPMTYTVP